MKKILTLSFTNYDAVPQYDIPISIIKAEDIMIVAQKELLPLFGAFLMNQGGGTHPRIKDDHSIFPIRQKIDLLQDKNDIRLQMMCEKNPELCR